jgi:hypothetical protein
LTPLAKSANESVTQGVLHALEIAGRRPANPFDRAMSFFFGGGGGGAPGNRQRSSSRAPAGAGSAGSGGGGGGGGEEAPREMRPEDYVELAAERRRQVTLATNPSASQLPLDAMLAEMVVSRRYEFGAAFAEVPGQPFLDLPTADRVFRSRVAPEETGVEDVRAIVAGRRQPPPEQQQQQGGG